MLDEPMAGMNTEETEDMARYIIDINEEMGITIILIEHDMNVVMDLSHRVVALDFGEKICEGEAWRGGEWWEGTFCLSGRREMGMTLLHYFFDRYKKNPKKVSFREKDLGIWKEYTWTDYFEKGNKSGNLFWITGVEEGDTIAIIGDNKPEWIISEIAAQLLGAYPIGIYQDSISSEVEYILTKAESKVVVAEDQEQVDKVLENVDKFPQLKKIIYYDSKGMYQYRDELLIFFDDIFQQVSKTDLDSYFEEKLKLLNENDIAVMCTTSGTTGHPKLAMLSHKNMIFMATSLAKADPKYESDEFVSFLPLPWIGEQMMSVASALIFGFTVNFPESHNSVQEDMKEIGPRIIFSPKGLGEYSIFCQYEDYGCNPF